MERRLADCAAHAWRQQRSSGRGVLAGADRARDQVVALGRAPGRAGPHALVEAAECFRDVAAQEQVELDHAGPEVRQGDRAAVLTPATGAQSPFGRGGRAGQYGKRGVGKRGGDAIEHARRQDTVIVGERDDRAARLAQAQIARVVRVCTRAAQMRDGAAIGEAREDRHQTVIAVLIDHDHFEIVASLRQQRVEQHADIRVAAANTTLLLPELKRGIHITWGLLPALSHTLGEQLVRYLALSTRPVPVSYLPHWIVERAPNDHVEDRVSELATRLADRPSTAARAIVDTLRCMGRDEPDPAALDAVRFADSMQCPETREALMAWMTGKRG